MNITFGKYRLEINWGLIPEKPKYPEWMIEIGELVKNGQNLAAVKLHKDNTGWGLKESKEFVDTVRDHYKESGEIKFDFKYANPIVK